MGAAGHVGFWVWVLAFLGKVATEEDEPHQSSAEPIKTMAWCEGVQEHGLSWSEVLGAAKSQCGASASPSGDQSFSMRVRCTPGVVAMCVEITRHLISTTASRSYFCANGITFVLSIALVYGRDDLAHDEVMRGRALLWDITQVNFMLDVSPWPVKTPDILELYDEYLPTLDFLELNSSQVAAEVHKGSESMDAITFLIPRCPASLAAMLKDVFPSVAMVVGLHEEAQVLKTLPAHWKQHKQAWKRPLGRVLNDMIQDVKTPMVMIIAGAVLPKDIEEVLHMARVLQSSRLGAVSAPLVDSNRIFMDFCYTLNARQWRLSFDTTYEYSLNFGETESTAVRGYWFREEHLEQKNGPCKLCQTLAPTFLSYTAVLRAFPPFNPKLDGEWALLDFALRVSQLPMVKVPESGSWPPGRRHRPLLFASCPFVKVQEIHELAGPHLYGRSDRPEGKSAAEAWFQGSGVALGPIWGVGANKDGMRPAEQAQLFADSSHLKFITWPDGEERHYGCRMDTTNCPVPDWIYRGWAVPPCCKETMRRLLFYLDDLFTEFGISYTVSDGVLLGSYKLGGMLDWDADVDLHIHDNDFDKLRTKQIQERIADDGYFLRQHVNNVSFLLQANDHNYLLIELNKRQEPFDPERMWKVPIEGRLFPAMEDAHVNLSAWYGMSFFTHRLRHVPPWEEAERPMFCSTPYHHNCVDMVPQGRDCRHSGIC